MPQYFTGSAKQLGTVTVLPQHSFAALCDEVLAKPERLPLTREAFAVLDKKARDTAKRTRYLTPCSFGSSPSPRKHEHAKTCYLICIDVDDSIEAKKLLAATWSDILGGLSAIVWHTASSSPEFPRLRVVVSTNGINPDHYPDAVRTIASMLGIQSNKESRVAVQPMYLPVLFQGDTDSPIVYQHTTGEDFLAIDIVGVSEEAASVDRPAAADATFDGIAVASIEFLRSPLEGITTDDARTALAHVSPDCSMSQWIEIGAGLKHQFGDEGFELWNTWSARGEKYTDETDTHYRWSTLKANTVDRAPVTIRTVFRHCAAAGWRNDVLSRRTAQMVADWIKNPNRSTEELFDGAPKRIASLSGVVSVLERKALISTLRDTLQARDMDLTLPDIKKEVQQLETDAARKTGVPPWARNLVFVTALNKFYRYTVDRHFTPEVIDLMHGIAGDEKALRPRDYLIQIAAVPQVENLRYDPRQRDKRIFQDDGVPYINIYRPSYPAPDFDRADEAGALILKHRDNLIAEPDYRRWFTDFLAYLVQKPGQKVRWVPLIQGCEGCGKTFWADLMSVALGKRNVSKLAGSNILEGTHNDWAYGTQLVVIEEIRVIGHNRHAVMDKLKPCISDDRISLRRMYEAARTVPNITNYVMFTNYQDSLAVTEHTRRYFVISSPMQREEDVKAMGGAEYFKPLFAMLDENPGGVRAFFENYKISSDFDPEGRAPVTTYLKELAENASSPLAAAVRNAITDKAHALVRDDLVSVQALRSVVQHVPGISDFSDQTLVQVLREMGWSRGERVRLAGERHALWTYGRSVKDAAAVARDRLELL